VIPANLSRFVHIFSYTSGRAGRSRAGRPSMCRWFIARRRA
jgi:hypothetical protein